jgi:hypothetical protein
VLDDNEGDAFGTQRPDHFRDFGAHDRAHSGGRLVEQDDLGLDHERAGKLEELLLSTREKMGRIVGELPETHPLQYARRCLDCFPFLARDGMKVRECLPDRLAALPQARNKQVFEHGERAKFPRDLKRSRQPAARAFMHGQFGYILVGKHHVASSRPQQTTDDVEECRLSRSVRADYSGDVRPRNFEANVIERSNAPEGFAHAANPQHGGSSLLERSAALLLSDDHSMGNYEGQLRLPIVRRRPNKDQRALFAHP